MSPPKRSLPLWKEDVSFRTADEHHVMRRQFGKFMVLTSFGMFAGNVWIVLRGWTRRLGAAPEPGIAVSNVSELAVGGVKIFTYPTPNDPCLLVRLDQTTWVAYSQKCTHLSCAVIYNRAAKQLECPCHHGFFSAETGRVLQGPPPRPLARVRLTRRGEEIFALGMEDTDG